MSLQDICLRNLADIAAAKEDNPYIQSPTIEDFQRFCQICVEAVKFFSLPENRSRRFYRALFAKDGDSEGYGSEVFNLILPTMLSNLNLQFKECRVVSLRSFEPPNSLVIIHNE